MIQRSGFATICLSWAALGLALGCQSNTRSAATPPPAYNPGAVPNPTVVELYTAPQVPRQQGSALLFMPGSVAQQRVNFDTINGQAVLEGDIMLGAATALPFRYGMPSLPASTDSKSAVAVANRAYLWPNAEIPYAVDPSAADKLSIINWAVQLFGSTSLRLRPATAADRDYVVFRTVNGGCWSYLGRQGGPQDVDVTSCGPGSIAHEIMHAAGFYHEQSRADRDDYISIVWDEISPELRFNFEKRDARGQDIGAYDYASIMHYPSHAGSRSGNPTIVPRNPNARIGQREGLSELDRAAIVTLYGSRSTPVASAPTPSVTPPAAAPPTAAPAPSATPLPAPSAPAPAPMPASSGASSTFAGVYASAQGDVSCTQGGVFVQCQFSGGNLFCAASGPSLSCTWSGSGQGRAGFQRQTSGVLAGTWGDGFSMDSRGRWDLTPRAASTAQPSAPAPVPSTAPPSAPPPALPPPSSVPTAPAASAVSLAGNYSSTRGGMTCSESGSGVSCNFQEPDGVPGRIDCAKSQGGLELSCAWITFLPRPATGRANFTRRNTSTRDFTGTWGLFLAPSGGGSWDMRGQ